MSKMHPDKIEHIHNDIREAKSRLKEAALALHTADPSYAEGHLLASVNHTERALEQFRPDSRFETKPIQTRNGKDELQYFDTVKQAIAHANADKTVWNISFAAENGERVRLIRHHTAGWVFEPIIPGFTSAPKDNER